MVLETPTLKNSLFTCRKMDAELFKTVKSLFIGLIHFSSRVTTQKTKECFAFCKTGNFDYVSMASTLF